MGASLEGSEDRGDESELGRSLRLIAEERRLDGRGQARPMTILIHPAITKRLPSIRPAVVGPLSDVRRRGRRRGRRGRRDRERFCKLARIRQRDPSRWPVRSKPAQVLRSTHDIALAGGIHSATKDRVASLKQGCQNSRTEIAGGSETIALHTATILSYRIPAPPPPAAISTGGDGIVVDVVTPVHLPRLVKRRLTPTKPAIALRDRVSEMPSSCATAIAGWGQALCRPGIGSMMSAISSRGIGLGLRRNDVEFRAPPRRKRSTSRA